MSEQPESLPARLLPLLDFQLGFERAHLACLRAAELGDEEALHRGRAARLHAMRALITARAAAGADSAPDRDVLKLAALAALARESSEAT
ncbi:hypothetical protein OG948_42950 (plasmid) [Embleya sp. NBC_00888]|uniref:hypothetical protein n=1 Tax=Embleya sp. NBC_00888 TaxID=2975960 RepID=UPI002F912F49|nr:hypothetical protein OG948_42950 [Embleya sp. NBC_00888]